ncbi:hypothetical protein CI665_000440 [Klebsiella quasipneumoniae subsp. similipneumoniae]|uniref:hypothetical protein n=1 Tax=Klebsiella quasipneumoniae TaxID=1463165 RepID=UPI001082F2D8|nr:hypothetical protein [Klebsiella quasipneumoniae]EIY4900093.1 hypothetical protein [Klebsiella quasipneumoniae]MEB7829463.1 hypothetical protein [Klebsiella quasipneumoniae]QPV87221.1 hypothetical protein I8N75_00430 [Klebsiella quasipneumoniae]TNJ76944.1 hypothetical protein CI665_000440 [Klebsiella quasipneumoniae subsp. similipneumoniae]HBR1387226.1 hypothetical protein [Klebsiella quasipneumoniae subsp. similipneumoniae]
MLLFVKKWNKKNPLRRNEGEQGENNGEGGAVAHDAVANFLFDGQNRIFHMGTIPLAAPQMGTGYIFYQPLPQEDELGHYQNMFHVFCDRVSLKAYEKV